MQTGCRLLAIIFSLLICSAGRAGADDAATTGAKTGVMTMPGEHCTADAKPDWSDAEKWAWDKICSGYIADMAEYVPGPEDPKTDTPWPDGRALSVRFLDTILLVEPYRSAVPNFGIYIEHAHFADPFNLADATLVRTLWLEESRFDGDVNLSTLHTMRLVGFDGSRFDGDLTLQRAQIDGSLFLHKILAKKGLTAAAAKIGSTATLNGAQIDGALDLGRITTGGGLFLDDIQAGSVDVSAGHIGDRLEFLNAKIAGAIDVNSVSVSGDVFLGGTEAASLDVSGAHIGGSLILNGMHVTGNTNIQRVSVGIALFARAEEKDGPPARFDGEFNMLGANITGAADFQEAKILGTLIMEQASIGGNLQLQGNGKNTAEFNEINMLSTRVGAALEISQANFRGPLHLNDAHIGQVASLSSGVEFFQPVEIIRTRVEGDVTIDNTTFDDSVDMHAIQIGSNLLMNEKTEFDKNLNLAFAHIGANLDLTNGTFTTVDLTGATIVSEIRLGTPTSTSPNWHSPDSLTLRNATAGALQDLPLSQPKTLDLEGFTYARIGGFGSPVDVLGGRDTGDFTAWLGKETPYSPQSYIQLATVFRNSGFPDKADWILFRGKLREMFNTLIWDKKHIPRPDSFLLLFVYCITTGFGIYPQLAAIWVILFVVLGVWIFGRDKEPTLVQMNRVDRAIYSLDMLIPVVHLRGKNYTFEPKSSRIRYYLYVHRFIGFLLATVLIASLSHGSVEFH